MTPPTVGLSAILKILFRWSFVVAPLVALTVWFALSQSRDVKPEYTVEASLLLTGPSEVLIEDDEDGEVTIGEVNPLESLGGTLSTVAQVTVLSMSDARVGQQLSAEGLSTSYTVGVEPRTPILRVGATAGDLLVATATAERLVQLLIDDLESRQDLLDAPEANRISAQLISLGPTGGADFGGRDRIRLAIGGVGLAMSAMSAFVLEGLTRPWRDRRRQRLAAQLAMANVLE